MNAENTRYFFLNENSEEIEIFDLEIAGEDVYCYDNQSNEYTLKVSQIIEKVDDEVQTEFEDNFENVDESGEV